jgi:hypothetical protein
MAVFLCGFIFIDMLGLRNLIFEFFEKDKITLRFVSKEDCEKFIKQHYIGKPPSAAQDYIGIFFETHLVGCVIYGAPSSVSLRAAINNQLPEQIHIGKGEISELKRLFISDGNFDKKGLASYAVAGANKMIEDRRNIKLIVSYSNTTTHPNATVYRASNAIYNGQVKDKIRWVYPMGTPKFRKYLRRSFSTNK